jgi:hypothetical protein
MTEQLSRRSVLAGLMLSALGAETASAHNWVRLGSRRVRLFADHDVIPVTLLKGNFRKIKLKVRENGIFIDRLVVVYSIGGTDNIPVQFNIKKGDETRVIDLRGGGRNIRSIQMFYRSVRNSKGTAEVIAYGRR